MILRAVVFISWGLSKPEIIPGIHFLVKITVLLADQHDNDILMTDCVFLCFSLYWDYAVTVFLDEIVYLHCHQQGE